MDARSGDGHSRREIIESHRCRSVLTTPTMLDLGTMILDGEAVLSSTSRADRTSARCSRPLAGAEDSGLRARRRHVLQDMKSAIPHAFSVLTARASFHPTDGGLGVLAVSAREGHSLYRAGARSLFTDVNLQSLA